MNRVYDDDLRKAKDRMLPFNKSRETTTKQEAALLSFLVTNDVISDDASASQRVLSLKSTLPGGL